VQGGGEAAHADANLPLVVSGITEQQAAATFMLEAEAGKRLRFDALLIGFI